MQRVKTMYFPEKDDDCKLSQGVESQSNRPATQTQIPINTSFKDQIASFLHAIVEWSN